MLGTELTTMKPQHILLAASLFLAATAVAQTADDKGGTGHAHHDHKAPTDSKSQAERVTEGGQGAFAAIQEVVTVLLNDPKTDWQRVDVASLRQHLIDMNNVTLRTMIDTRHVEGGASFSIRSADPDVRSSIRSMTTAHASTMDGVNNWSLKVETTEDGAILTATGDAQRIRALGFIGLMTVGMHHQAHHLALARGEVAH